ncbi:LOW QUALITY PROTEIN: N6-adenosine-methyltransferase subunit METTL3-like [Condylostylus longicornis]|uniref:LOW QUALITY PROTEIN: N6-adenosine-methyltransferase subunit METTL3-like n=1 Tax=Condylostylus longicornis TaxID=2530218 RepID=UPI00244E4741|nr:LOW QUALITY PROTEIN: N6-adenosine-methyltransferase subunit METTL3-like [Condylostylus longicornis]
MGRQADRIRAPEKSAKRPKMKERLDEHARRREFQRRPGTSARKVTLEETPSSDTVLPDDRRGRRKREDEERRQNDSATQEVKKNELGGRKEQKGPSSERSFREDAEAVKSGGLSELMPPPKSLEPRRTHRKGDSDRRTTRRTTETRQHAEPVRHPSENCRKNSADQSGTALKTGASSSGLNIEELLSAPSAKEKQIMDSSAELRDLLTVPTAKHSITTRSFQSRGGSKVQQICPRGTRHDCLIEAIEKHNELKVCGKIHFRRIMFPHTDLSLGDCSYLDTCRHMSSCRFVHYEVDLDVGTEEQKSELLDRMDDSTRTAIGTVSSSQLEELPAQWIHCDIRKIDFSIFRGKVKIVMADPPWDIHMDLPYGTMTDNEMKSLRLDQVQDEGLLFLWVTGRAMELGRECMQLWGYRRLEEIVWVKTNQLQRVIRTGRTGHWLNHSKEHCLVGIKGDPKLNRHLDTDLIVAEVRETSRKPDEVYRIIERLCPWSLKLELFGRQHNVRNNWITLGNQLDAVRLHDASLVHRYNSYASKSGLPLYDQVREHQPPDGH